MRIFITGVNGFIGSNLAKFLIDKGHIVSGSVRPSSNLDFIKNLNINLITGDIRDQKLFNTNLKNQEIVYHIAGKTADWGKFEDFYQANVLGTMNIAKAAMNNSVKRFVFISSTAVYGFSGFRYLTEEAKRPKSTLPYISTKMMAEDWLNHFSKENNLDTTIIQPANVYGPNDRTFFLKFVQGLEKGILPWINNGASWTCPTYIENLANALWIAGNHENAINETFIISDGIEINWRQFINQICCDLDINPPGTSISYPMAYHFAKGIESIFKVFRLKREPLISLYRVSNFGKDYHFSIEKAMNVLGYSPKIPVSEGIWRTVQWYKRYKENID